MVTILSTDESFAMSPLLCSSFSSPSAAPSRFCKRARALWPHSPLQPATTCLPTLLLHHRSRGPALNPTSTRPPTTLPVWNETTTGSRALRAASLHHSSPVSIPSRFVPSMDGTGTPNLRITSASCCPVRFRCPPLLTTHVQSLPQMGFTSAMSFVRISLLFHLHATNRSHVTRLGFPDPFAVATINGEQTRTTSVIKKTLNPYWNESFDMYVTPVLEAIHSCTWTTADTGPGG